MSLLSTHLPSLSDQELLSLCAQYGTQAKVWKQKFLGLLPEVQTRQVYLKYSCSSIFEFAAKVGGVSREQVLLVLQLHKRFEHTPQLHQALTSGQISIHKLARIASVATPENEQFLAQQAHHLSKQALETFVRDVKSLPGQAQNPNKTAKQEKIPQSEQLQLSPAVTQRLLKLQNTGLDLNHVLTELLDHRDQQIQEEKAHISQELRGKGEAVRAGGSTSPSRYIPKKVKAVLHKEFGLKCAQEHCIHTAQTIHHTRRFSIDPSHNPLFLAPLCTQHHEIAHAIDVRVMEERRHARSIRG